MEMIRSETFEFEGKTYDLLVFFDGEKWSVLAYLGKQRANPYIYSVEVMTAVAFYRKFGDPAIDHLLEFAREDIRNKTWERYKEAVRFSEAVQQKHEICERLKKRQREIIEKLSAPSSGGAVELSQREIDDLRAEATRIERMMRENKC